MDCNSRVGCSPRYAPMLEAKYLKTTAYNPETIGQVERYNRTIVTRLQHYVAENQKEGAHACIRLPTQLTRRCTSPQTQPAIVSYNTAPARTNDSFRTELVSPNRNFDPDPH